MDRLLVVTPREVRFHLEIGKTGHAKIRLQNLMHTMPVAFKVFTTAPHKYAMRSQSVIIPPLEEHLLEIAMAAQSSLPEDLPYSNDKIYVKSLMVPTGKATRAELDKWFSTRKKHVFSDATLKIVFTGNHVLWRLAVDGSMECVKEVLRDTHANAKDYQDRTALFIAARHGNIGAVKALVASKCNVNDKSCTMHTPLFEAVLGGHFEVVKFLLDAGAETEHKNGRGWTCLHAAAAQNHAEIVNLLLDAGANMNVMDERGRTPLHEAASAENSEVLFTLIQCGADVEKRSHDGCTPLHEAAAGGNKEAMRILLEKGADITVRNREKKTSRDLAQKIGESNILDVMHVQRMLEKAVRTNNMEVVRECLRLGVYADVCDQHGWTALHRAAFKGNVHIVRMLIEHEFDMNMEDERGYTPLHCAIEAGHKDVVELLLKHKADIAEGLTTLLLGCTAKHSGVWHLVEDAKSSYLSCE